MNVYFASITHIYSTTTPTYPALRLAVIEAAVTEINQLLSDPTTQGNFLGLLAKTPDFQTDILRFLVNNPERPVHVMMQQLCEDCGPVTEENKYGVEQKCSGCGKEKSLEFY